MGFAKNWENFFEEQENKNAQISQFVAPVVSPEIFFRDWMRQPLSPAQLEAINAIFTADFTELSNTNELYLLVGEGGGKDFLCERILIYMAYWLVNHRSPHAYLNRAEGTPIDLVNTSVTEEHAANVFFKQFCEALPLVINPATGHNWFEEQGMDLRQGKDILTSMVRFPKFITAYSCNSQRYTAEGKNVLLGILDEIAEFKYDKAKALFNNLKSTCTSRFPTNHKVILISYPRSEFDFMMTKWNEYETLPQGLRDKIFRMRKTTWEMNPKAKKEDYKDAYDKDPEDSAKRYECIIPKKNSLKYIRNGDKILSCIRSYDLNDVPIISDTPFVSTKLTEETFAPWFKPGYVKEMFDIELQLSNATLSKEEIDKLKLRLETLKEQHTAAKYFIHIDLAKGSYDFAGFTLMHTYQKTESLTGYYVDFVCQLQPLENEIDFEDIQTFVDNLIAQGYNIANVSFDQWNSVGFMQHLSKAGVPNKEVSMDRSTQPYNTLKDMIYKGLLSFYYHPILVRELNELQMEDGKVDHPRESMQRYKEEGRKAGSKDVADSLAGTIFSASSEAAASSGACGSAPSGNAEDEDDIEELLRRSFGG